ncbi:hypothetical protein ACFQ78_41115 [Streptomyces sp. NPDC056519]|uniref:hypothetical protein n=1 Tax=Streptomyces sp. NPDC056519 TaxID=3345849 RepID=UPI00367719D9
MDDLWIIGNLGEAEFETFVPLGQSIALAPDDGKASTQDIVTGAVSLAEYGEFCAIPNHELTPLSQDQRVELGPFLSGLPGDVRVVDEPAYLCARYPRVCRPEQDRHDCAGHLGWGNRYKRVHVLAGRQVADGSFDTEAFVRYFLSLPLEKGLTAWAEVCAVPGRGETVLEVSEAVCFWTEVAEVEARAQARGSMFAVLVSVEQAGPPFVARFRSAAEEPAYKGLVSQYAQQRKWAVDFFVDVASDPRAAAVRWLETYDEKARQDLLELAQVGSEWNMPARWLAAVELEVWKNTRPRVTSRRIPRNALLEKVHHGGRTYLVPRTGETSGRLKWPHCQRQTWVWTRQGADEWKLVQLTTERLLD